MRAELLGISEKEYWVYGPKEEDFSFTIDLVEGFILANQEKLQGSIDELYKREDIDDQSACEVHDDLAHYAWVNEQYLWQFCLWRLQGIFESIIIVDIAPKKPHKKLLGIKAKVNFLKRLGFKLTPDEEAELTAWADLRNALSHAPPEQYSPGPLRKEDVHEYAAFLRNLCEKLRIQADAL